MKQNSIFKILHEKITNGVYDVGDKLPTELELAAKYNVARGTIRASLDRLEKQGLLERVRSKGTFVRQSMQMNPADRVISFLIPYPHYMRMTRDPVFTYFSRTFYGAVRAASEKGWRVQTVPFSRTNDNSDIDWRAMEHLHQGSRLIIFNHWYHTAYEEFHRRGIRVASLRSFHENPSPWDAFYADWVDGVLLNGKAAMDNVRLLHERGCRKILCVAAYYDDPYNEWTGGYRKAVDNLGLDRLELDSSEYYSMSDGQQRLAQAIEAIWKCTRFDGLLVGGGGMPPEDVRDYYQHVGIPESVKVIFSQDRPTCMQMDPQVSAMSQDADHMGYTLAKALMRPTHEPGKIFFEQTFHDRQSTGGPYLNPAMIEQDEPAWPAGVT